MSEKAEIKEHEVTVWTKPPRFKSRQTSQVTDVEALPWEEAPGKPWTVGYDGRVFGLMSYGRFSIMAYRAEDILRDWEEYLKPGEMFYFDAGQTYNALAITGSQLVQSFLALGLLTVEQIPLTEEELKELDVVPDRIERKPQTLNAEQLKKLKGLK